MSKSLDGKVIRIKGSDVVTRVRYCSDDEGVLKVVTEMSCLHPSDTTYPGAERFVSEDNPYGDFFPLDQIELQNAKGDWYTPEFRVAGPK